MTSRETTASGLRGRDGPGALRIALAGAGYIADWHARAVRRIAGAELVAVCDRAVARARALAGVWGVRGVYDSLERMLQNERLDVVHVLLPPEAHFDAAMMTIAAGVNVFLEKPMCITAEQCDRLIDEAARRGLRVAVGHNFLFSRPYEQLAADVRGGVLGRIDHVTIAWHRELPQLAAGPFDAWMLRDPGNIMLEVGPHSMAHLVDLLGQPAAMDVKAGNPRRLPSGAIFYRRWQIGAWTDSAAAELSFSFVPGFAEHHIHVRGSLGSATADLERNTYVRRLHTPRADDIDRYSIIRREACDLVRQGRRNLWKWMVSKLLRRVQGNAYGASIEAAIRAFYDSAGANIDPRIDPRLGRTVVELCARAAGAVAAESAHMARPACRPTAAVPAATTLVFGASGFIGAELVRQLAAMGRPVRVLVRNPGKLPSDVLTPLVEVLRGDLENPEDLARSLEGIHCVFHLARAMVKTWADYAEHDIEVTRSIGEACLAAGVRRLIYTGTIDSYYAGRAAGTITEATGYDRRIRRRNLYARAKAASEDLLMAMHRERGLPVVIIRPGIVIGRGGHPFHWGVGMWKHGTVCQIWGRGDNKLPFVLVDDVASGLIAAMDTPHIDGESFNLVADPCLSAREYLDELERAAGIRLQRIPTSPLKFYLVDMLKWLAKVVVRHPERRLPSYRDWESRTQRAVFDCSKAKQRLGWRPVADRGEMVRRGIELPVREFLL